MQDLLEGVAGARRLERCGLLSRALADEQLLGALFPLHHLPVVRLLPGSNRAIAVLATRVRHYSPPPPGLAKKLHKILLAVKHFLSYVWIIDNPPLFCYTAVTLLLPCLSKP